ncbi:hypothetical protein BLA15945_04482 [Burkholderia lata]|uniref:Uncharacterized protein n=1 Tax=Burkholderia lata (strain ATCC 17760 / DSM 23089 / LMG 22485 / NCIMB 9086 / R18194 / 383) TaxID=482957 RepID=A0A6P2N3F2_BURL3|nr:hypothetical protein BLA15945_04482 [Burkholderia lata]
MIELSAAGYAAELKRFRATGSVWLAADEIPADVDVPPAWRTLLAVPDDVRADALVRMWAGIIDRLPAVAHSFATSSPVRPCSATTAATSCCCIRTRSSTTT